MASFTYKTRIIARSPTNQKSCLDVSQPRKPLEHLAVDKLKFRNYFRTFHLHPHQMTHNWLWMYVLIPSLTCSCISMVQLACFSLAMIFPTSNDTVHVRSNDTTLMHPSAFKRRYNLRPNINPYEGTDARIARPRIKSLRHVLGREKLPVVYE